MFGRRETAIPRPLFPVPASTQHIPLHAATFSITSIRVCTGGAA